MTAHHNPSLLFKSSLAIFGSGAAPFYPHIAVLPQFDFNRNYRFPHQQGNRIQINFSLNSRLEASKECEFYSRTLLGF